MNRKQALRVSPLKQSTGLLEEVEKYFISSDMLLQLNLSAYDA